MRVENVREVKGVYIVTVADDAHELNDENYLFLDRETYKTYDIITDFDFVFLVERTRNRCARLHMGNTREHWNKQAQSRINTDNRNALLRFVGSCKHEIKSRIA